MATPLSIKRDYTTFALDVLSEDLKAIASQVYDRECGVTIRELRLLRCIGAEPGLVLSRLIQLARLEKTLASKHMTDLVRRGLVVRSVGTVDARNILIHLTEAGRDVVMRAEPIGRRMEAMLLKQLTDEEVAVFHRCLAKLAGSKGAVTQDVDRYLSRRAARAQA